MSLLHWISLSRFRALIVALLGLSGQAGVAQGDETLFTYELGIDVNGLGVAPNPSAGAVQVSLAAEAGVSATVAVFDALGRQVAVLHEGAVAGALALTLDGGSLPSGVYVVRAVVSRPDGTTEILARALTVAR